jgi:hypothetical protein
MKISPRSCAGVERLLAEAGYPGGNSMPPFEVSTLPEFRQEFAYYVSQWNNLGIPVLIAWSTT